MKIFLCSTSYDLQDIRALIVDRFGQQHKFIHFEDPAFPLKPGLHSHDQCIEAVKRADVVLCLIDQRYGGRYHGAHPDDFREQAVDFKGTIAGKEITIHEKVPAKDLSITWCELITAYRESKFVFTFARQRTLDEKATRRKNQGITDFCPAYVEENRLFDLVDWITKQERDNWISPFNDGADLINKLEPRLSVGDALVLPPATGSVNKKRRPITVIVEGRTDAQVARAVEDKLDLRAPLNIIVAEGKQALIGNLKIYAQAFKSSGGIVVLADADTIAPAEVDAQKTRFRQLLAESGRPDASVILTVPEIESWLGKTDFRRSSLRSYNKLFEELHFLQTNLEQRAAAIPSLAEFINVLRTIDAQP